jgi:hypothetical protein
MQVVPYSLPTGAELMSTPIPELEPDPPQQKKMTKMEEEIEWVMENIANRISALRIDESFELHKWLIFSFGIFSSMMGLTLLFYGLHYSIFFERYDGNIIAIVFSGFFFLPLLFWFKFIFFPSPRQERMRHRMRFDRRERRKKTFFNDMVEEARKANEDPPRKIRVFAHIRKHDIPIVATNWREFCELLENHAGIPVERQLIRFNDIDLSIDLRKNLFDREYGLNDGSRLYIYNKGGILFCQHLFCSLLSM